MRTSRGEGDARERCAFTPHSESGAELHISNASHVRFERERERERERAGERAREREWEEGEEKGTWKGVLFIHYRDHTLSHRERKEKKDMFVVHCSGLLEKQNGKGKRCNTRRAGRRRGGGEAATDPCGEMMEGEASREARRRSEASPRPVPYPPPPFPPPPKCKSATLRHCKIIGVLITQFSTK